MSRWRIFLAQIALLKGPSLAVLKITSLAFFSQLCPIVLKSLNIYNLNRFYLCFRFYAFRSIPDFRVLISGGDGTVGWMLSCLDDIVQEMKCKLPAVLPLSTGKGIVTNDSCAPRFWSKFKPFDKLGLSDGNLKPIMTLSLMFSCCVKNNEINKNRKKVTLKEKYVFLI